MVSEKLLAKFEKIKNKEEYERMLHNLKMSSGLFEEKQEAIRALQTECSRFVNVDRTPSAKLYSDMRDGQADIDDIN